MSDDRSKAKRVWRVAVLALATGAVAVSVASAACLTAVPDLPQYPLLPPSIEDEAVEPPEGNLLLWPEGGEFTIPVRILTPGETYVYEFVYDFGTPEQKTPLANLTPELAPDGGVAVIPVTLPDPPDPTLCPHRIDFVVAHAFQGGVPDSVGSDTASWTYYGGGGSGVCPSYDAGSGELPDASNDVLPRPGGDP